MAKYRFFIGEHFVHKDTDRVGLVIARFRSDISWAYEVVYEDGYKWVVFEPHMLKVKESSLPYAQNNSNRL